MKFLYKVSGLLYLILFFIVFTSCESKNISHEDNNKLKIISLSPSNTEILIGLSLGENIIGADEYSEKVYGINPNARIFKMGDPNIEGILELNPDLVLLSGDIFSLSKFSKLKNFGIEVLNIETAKNINEIYESILYIGRKTSKINEANEMIKDLKNKIEEIRKDNLKKDLRVYFEISNAPYICSFGSETFLNELLLLLGVENIFKDLSGWISPNEEYIINANPQIIFTNVNVKGNIDEIKNRVGWENIDAVKNNRVYYIDENYSSRPSQFFTNAVYQMNDYIKEVLNEK